jgi:hypothetical protein
MNQKTRHTFDSFFTFLLLLVFALFTLLLCAMGSSIYRNGVAHLNENYTSRTAIAYLSEKVRQHDSSEDIFLTEVESIPAIGFADEIDGASFVTYVYFYDGALRELFVRKDTTPLADMGNRIVELAGFELSLVHPDSDRTVSSDTDTVLDTETVSDTDASYDTTTSTVLLRAAATSEDGNELSILIHPSSTGIFQ